MQVLPDILAASVRVVFAAPAVGECAAVRGHYYAGPHNAFWQLLHESGVTPRRLAHTEDVAVLEYRAGLADVVKDRDDPVPRFDVEGFVGRVGACAPSWIAFNGKTVASAVAGELGYKVLGLGAVDWMMGGAQVFVLPSSSGANRRRDYDGRATRLEWWQELASYLR
jgi:double-stranded uracil-DNA glycosylase